NATNRSVGRRIARRRAAAAARRLQPCFVVRGLSATVRPDTLADMSAVLSAPAPRPLPLILGWPRVRVMFIIALGFAVVHFDSPTPFRIWFARTLTVGMFATIAYGVFERWPARLPSWVARWSLQILGVILAGVFGAC